MIPHMYFLFLDFYSLFFDTIVLDILFLLIFHNTIFSFLIWVDILIFKFFYKLKGYNFVDYTYEWKKMG